MKRKLKKIAAVICSAAMLLGTAVSSVAFAEEYMNYEVFVEPQYEDALTFSCGYAAVKQNGKWGYINEDGEMVVAPIYDYASYFSEGRALVGTLSEETAPYYYWPPNPDYYEMGIIDENGNYTPLMRDAEIFDDDNWEFIKMEQKPFLINEYYLFAHVVDENGDPVTTVEYNYEYEYEYELEVLDYSDFSHYYYYNGYISLPNDSYFADFSDASYLVFDRYGQKIDNSLNDIEDEWGIYNFGGVYTDGLFNVYFVMHVGDIDDIKFSDINGNIAVQLPAYDEFDDRDIDYFFRGAYNFFDGYAGAWVVKDWEDWDEEPKFALINKNGEILFTGDYTKVYTLIVNTNGSDEPARRVVNEGLITLEFSGEYWGAVDVNGNTVIPFEYEALGCFNEGLCAAKKDGLWGFLDHDGKFVIEPQYENVTAFNNGLALAVTPDGEPRVIDRYNNVLGGSDNVPLDCYFTDEITLNINEIILIEEAGKYGFARLDYGVALPKEEDMSSWAYNEVTEAIEKELVPIYLQNQYYTNIRRDDFAQLIVAALEEVTGQSADEILKEKTGIDPTEIYDQNPFSDTSDRSIIIANKLGIINGVSATEFAPSQEITRQDAAALLMRAAKLISDDVPEQGLEFADSSDIADYAKNAVSYVTGLKIMNGVGDNRFDPTSAYTREQAYIAIVRLFNNLTH